MSLINYTQLEDGQPASANGLNERFGSIVDTVNGNIDAQNIKNGSITREKIAPGSVTSDKLQVSKYVDENGWTVTDYGTVKDYTYRKVATIQLPPQTWKEIIIPLPVGIASVDDLVISQSIRSGLTETILTIVSTENKAQIRYAMYNAHASYNFNGQYRMDLMAKAG